MGALDRLFEFAIIVVDEPLRGSTVVAVKLRQMSFFLEQTKVYVNYRGLARQVFPGFGGGVPTQTYGYRRLVGPGRYEWFDRAPNSLGTTLSQPVPESGLEARPLIPRVSNQTLRCHLSSRCSRLAILRYDRPGHQCISSSPDLAYSVTCD